MTHHLFAGVETGDDCLDRYLNQITSEHNQMPRFMDTVALSVKPTCDALKIAYRLLTLFDIDTAVGQQLDWLGRWIGMSRRITVEDPKGFFSLDIPELGLDEAQWYGSDINSGTALVLTLDDEEYRLVLKTRILANYWNGDRDQFYDILNYYFKQKGYETFLYDNYQHGQGWFTWDDPNPACGWDQGYWDQTDPADVFPCTGNMWMLQLLYGPSPPSPLIMALFAGGYFDLRPAGVGDNYYRNNPAFPDRPIFGWDEGPNAEEWDSGTATLGHPPIAGWDIGAWALQINPLHYTPATALQYNEAA